MKLKKTSKPIVKWVGLLVIRNKKVLMLREKDKDFFVLPGRAENELMVFKVYGGEIVGEITLGEDIEKIKWLDSRYEAVGCQVGNITRMKLFPELLRKKLIT